MPVNYTESVLPACLNPRSRSESSISLVRALKNIIEQLEQSNNPSNEDGVQIAIDDAKTMLDCVI